jgi:hypothetical protein
LGYILGYFLQARLVTLTQLISAPKSGDLMGVVSGPAFFFDVKNRSV